MPFVLGPLSYHCAAFPGPTGPCNGRLLAGQLTVDDLTSERSWLADSLLPQPSTAVLHPPAAPLEGLVTRRQLLTHVALWRVSPSAHPAGVWPRLLNQCWSLGPAPSAAFPLLRDGDVLDLLCHGSYDGRPVGNAAARLALAQLRLDEHDRAARMRAIHCAQIFFTWRDTQSPFPDTAATAALAATRAAMARLIVNFDVNLAPSSLDRLGVTVEYPPAHIPLGGFASAPPPPPPPPAGRGESAPAGGAPGPARGRAPRPDGPSSDPARSRRRRHGP